MKFAFHARVTIEGMVMVEAETEAEAWAKVLDGQHKVENPVSLRKPTYKRQPDKDDYGL